MKRIYAIFFATAMLVPLVACKTDKESADVTTSEITVTRTGPPEKSTDDYYDLIASFKFNYDDVQFSDGCLSSEIPETAVVKEIISYFSRDYENIKTINNIEIYCDEYDNELLRLESVDGGNFYAVNNYKYEYDENGNKITEYYIDENSEDVTKYQYYDDGKIVVSERKTAEGNFRERDYTEYDEYGNIILSCHSSYDIFENDTLNEPVVRELRNIRYDSSGNILSYDFYSYGNEKPTFSFVLTYDDKNRLLTSEEYFTEHDKSDYDYCEKLEYSYEADCDEPTLFVKTEMDTPDHIEGTVTEEREYDEKGRVVYYKSYNSTYDNVVKIIETEYEELK